MILTYCNIIVVIVCLILRHTTKADTHVHARRFYLHDVLRNKANTHFRIDEYTRETPCCGRILGTYPRWVQRMVMFFVLYLPSLGLDCSHRRNWTRSLRYVTLHVLHLKVCEPSSGLYWAGVGAMLLAYIWYPTPNDSWGTLNPGLKGWSLSWIYICQDFQPVNTATIIKKIC